MQLFGDLLYHKYKAEGEINFECSSLYDEKNTY